MARPPNSWVWEHFQEDTSQVPNDAYTSVKCKVCKKSLRYSSRNGPTNLARHLTRSHSMHAPDSNITRRPFEPLNSQSHSNERVEKSGTSHDHPQPSITATNSDVSVHSIVSNNNSNYTQSNVTSLSNFSNNNTSNNNINNNNNIDKNTNNDKISDNNTNNDKNTDDDDRNKNGDNNNSITKYDNKVIQKPGSKHTKNKISISDINNSTDNIICLSNQSESKKENFKQSQNQRDLSPVLNDTLNNKSPPLLNPPALNDSHFSLITPSRYNDKVNFDHGNHQHQQQQQQQDILFQTPMLNKKGAIIRPSSRGLNNDIFLQTNQYSDINASNPPLLISQDYNKTSANRSDYDQFMKNVNLLPLYRMEVGKSSTQHKSKLMKNSTLDNRNSSTDILLNQTSSSPSRAPYKFKKQDNTNSQQILQAQPQFNQLSPNVLKIANMTPQKAFENSYYMGQQSYLSPLHVSQQSEINNKANDVESRDLSATISENSNDGDNIYDRQQSNSNSNLKSGFQNENNKSENINTSNKDLNYNSSLPSFFNSNIPEININSSSVSPSTRSKSHENVQGYAHKSSGSKNINNVSTGYDDNGSINKGIDKQKTSNQLKLRFLQMQMQKQQQQQQQLEQLEQLEQLGQLNSLGLAGFGQFDHFDEQLGYLGQTNDNTDISNKVANFPQILSKNPVQQQVNSNSRTQSQYNTMVEQYTENNNGIDLNLVSGNDDGMSSRNRKKVSNHTLLRIVKDLQKTVYKLESVVAEQNKGIIELKQQVARNVNRTRGNGMKKGYDILPFVSTISDDTKESKSGDELPKLKNIITLFTLTTHEVDEYLKLYDISNTDFNSDDEEDEIIEEDTRLELNNINYRDKNHIFQLGKFIGCKNIKRYWKVYAEL